MASPVDHKQAVELKLDQGGTEIRPEVHLWIDRERVEMMRKLANGKFTWLLDDPDISNRLKLPVLIEEVGEIATAMKEVNSQSLILELAQVAACCTMWLEAMIPVDESVVRVPGKGKDEVRLELRELLGEMEASEEDSDAVLEKAMIRIQELQDSIR